MLRLATEIMIFFLNGGDDFTHVYFYLRGSVLGFGCFSTQEGHTAGGGHFNTTGGDWRPEWDMMMPSGISRGRRVCTVYIHSNV